MSNLFILFIIQNEFYRKLFTSERKKEKTKVKFSDGWKTFYDKNLWLNDTEIEWWTLYSIPKQT